MPLRILIADDEPEARQRLRGYLAQESDTEIVAECGEGNSALKAIRKTVPDLVFMDIKMPELNGFEIIEKLPQATVPVIIFTTADNQYAIKAFEVFAVDYLLKPIDHERFEKALSRGRERLAQCAKNNGIRELLEFMQQFKIKETTNDRLAVRSSGRIIFVGFSDIAWISGAGNYAKLHVGKTVHLLRQTLSSLEEMLPQHFARISKSGLVNVKFIRQLKSKSHGDCVITLQDGTELVATRSYRIALRSKLDL